MVLRKEFVVRTALAAAGIAGVWVAWAQQQRQPLTMEKVTIETV